MTKQTKQDQTMTLQASGFVLLFFGILLSVILDLNIVFEVIGVIMVIASAVIFGITLGARNRKKK